MEEYRKLRATRIPVNIEAIYEFKGVKGKCTILDISETGMRLEVKQILVPGDILKVTFNIVFQQKPYTIEAWCIVRNSSGNEIGVQFDELSNEKKKILIGYVEELVLKYGKSKQEPI
ncbi:MAG: PilZ domain-containing protein [Brevinematia bacterium]